MNGARSLTQQSRKYFDEAWKKKTLMSIRITENTKK